MKLTDETIAYIDAHAGEYYELLLSLARIPAPSMHEERRAAFIQNWLINSGAKSVSIDSAKNVICKIGDCDGDRPLVVFMAHMDVVFPDIEELPLKVENGRIWCPGVGDDTANLVAMLFATRYIIEKGLQAEKYGILVVANSCEEGLGDLKGSRKIMEEYGDRIVRFISFDSWNGSVNHCSIGSKRYRISVETEGGHSYYDAGNRNAIATLSSMIGTLYKMKTPSEKTTYNVGVISGGTSVNTIASHAEMLFEYRSENIENGSVMEKQILSVIDEYRSRGIKVYCEVIGDRPCMGRVEEEGMNELLELSSRVYREYYGKEPVFKAGSTDCNIPLSKGIPSICAGCFDGGGAHTRDEYVLIDSLPTGYRMAFAHMLYFF